MMTRRHFQLVAASLRAQDADPARIARMADILAKTNRRFSRERFIAAASPPSQPAVKHKVTTMIETRGSDWVDPPEENARAWCKVISAAKHIDLTESGGYAIKGVFLDFDKKVVLGPDQFLLIGVQRPTGGMIRDGDQLVPDYRYEYALVQGAAKGQQARLITEDGLYKTTYNAIDADLLPDYRESRALNSPVYMMAVYCSMWYAIKAGEVSIVQRAIDTRHLTTKFATRPARWIDRPAKRPPPAEPPPALPPGRKPRGRPPRE